MPGSNSTRRAIACLLVLVVVAACGGGSPRADTSTFLTGMKNPVPVVLAGNALYTGDWTTGTIYRITSR